MDFSIPPELAALQERTRVFIREQIIPLEADPRQTAHGPTLPPAAPAANNRLAAAIMGRATRSITGTSGSTDCASNLQPQGPEGKQKPRRCRRGSLDRRDRRSDYMVV